MNKCTPALFALAPDAASMAALEVGRIAECIRTLGLAPTKARNLKAMSQVRGADQSVERSWGVGRRGGWLHVHLRGTTLPPA